MKIIKGDLIDLALKGNFDVIVHGCNCFNVMGAGIARQIRMYFAEAYRVDCLTKSGDRKKLGTINAASVPINQDKPLIIVNAYTQYHPGADVSYDAIRSCFKAIKEMFPGFRIGYPKIGAGIAGGDWTVISEIIDKALEGEDHTLVEYCKA